MSQNSLPDDKIDLLAPAKTKLAFAKNNGVSLPTLCKLVKAGRGPAMTRLGGRVVIMPEDELAWRREQRDLVDADQRALDERRAAHCRKMAKLGGRRKQ